MFKIIKKIFLGLIAVILILVLYLVYTGWATAFGFPYGKNNLNSGEYPEFTKFDISHEHFYNSKTALPVIGSAMIDVDGDGVDEVFLSGGEDQQDSLFKYTDNGFIEVSENHGVNKKLTGAASYGAAVIDYDRDGDSDMFLARNDGVYLFVNDNGVLNEQKTDIEVLEGEAPLTLALGDINLDGNIDIFVSAYLKADNISGFTIFNDDLYGANSLMLLGNDDGTFTDITKDAGMENIHNTFQGTFVDIDLDGDQDLVVAYDTGTVKTWRNEFEETGDLIFTDVPNPTTDVFGYPMGIAVGDYNNDGLTDFAFSNIGDLGPLRTVVRGDLNKDQVLNHKTIVFENKGDFKFEDVSEEINVADYEFGWGLVFEDFNNDAQEDLVIAQNYISLLPHKLFRLPSRFLVQKDGDFQTVEKDANAVNREFPIAPLYSDFNKDGQLDFIYANLSDKSVGFINKGNDNPYLGVELRNTIEMVGAIVTVKTDVGDFKKTLSVSEGLASDSTHRLLFGLPDASEVLKIELEYMNGDFYEDNSVEINTYIKAYEQ